MVKAPPAWVLLGLVALAPLAAADVDSDDVLDRLQQWLDSTRDLQCRFEQSLLSSALGADVSEGGRFYLKRPGMLRWEYDEPDPKLALVRGAEAWLYLPDERQLIHGGEEWSGSVLTALLAGDRPLDELFVASTQPNEPGEDGLIRLQLLPRGETEGFETVTLLVHDRSFAIRGAEVLDAAGNRMLYRFRSQRRNRGLDDELFAFEPPEGTEILESP